jgi:hypothetical protein
MPSRHPEARNKDFHKEAGATAYFSHETNASDGFARGSASEKNSTFDERPPS